ncbi:MAG: hypothetical protein HOP15_17365 [Planctomycetes bacterium]|nr:hypothetical protein [Planctomycetota bacterium]
MPRHALVPFTLTLAVFAPRIAAQDTLYVTSRNTDEVLRYDATSGAFLGVFASGSGLDNPVGLTFGPDGHLYVANDMTDQVLRYDGTSGAFIDVFAQGSGLNGPRQVNFGPDGHLYVSSGATDQVLRYDGASGAFLGVAAAGGNLRGPTSFTFGPNGQLFVGSVLNNRIKRYDPESGAFLGDFVTTNLNGPHDLAFGPDGKLYVTNAFSTSLQRFSGATGAFLDTFVQDARFVNPLGLCWNEHGDLLVANQGRNEVLRYDGRNGTLLGTSVAPGAGGLSGPLFAAFGPRAGFRLLPPVPGIAGRRNFFALSGATPGAALRLGIDDGPELRLERACSGQFVLAAALRQHTYVADESGRAFLRTLVPPSALGRLFVAQALELRICRATPLLLMRF